VKDKQDVQALVREHDPGPDMADQTLSDRQAEVLDAALSLLVRLGEKGLTTAAIARAANCSKESLYKWFGDRDGLLAAMIAHQAGKVRIGQLLPSSPSSSDPMALTVGSKAQLRKLLIAFADNLLAVLGGDVSLALNRLAIGQQSRQGSRLGFLLLEHGRKQIGLRVGALLEAGRAEGLIRFEDRDDAFETLYGLIVRDSHVRMLLGDMSRCTPRARSHTACRAVDHFLRLFGTGPDHAAETALTSPS